MDSERLLVALLVVSIVAGCSSKVELEFEGEEVRTAVHTDADRASQAGRARTRVRLAAERTLLEPQPPRIAVPSPRVEEDAAPEPSVPPTETRYVPVTPPAPVVTSIHVGDIDIHIGDVVRVRTETYVEKDEFPVRDADDGRPAADRSRSPSASQGPPPATDRRCDGLMDEHQARVRRWEALFRR